MTLNNSAYTRTRFRAKLFQLSGETSTRFRAKPISTFGRNIEWPSVVPCSSYAWANVLWIIWVLRTWFTALPIPLSLNCPPLCMQCGRYSFCGIHAAALLKHTVIGWCLHHADYYCAHGVIHCLGKIHLILTIFSRKSHRNRKCRPGMIHMPYSMGSMR